MRRALYILADLDDGDIAWLASAGSVRKLPAGQTIIQEGVPIKTLYIVIDGSLEVMIGGSRRVAELAVGDIIGEMSLIEKRPPSATVRTLENSQLLCIEQSALIDHIGRNPTFAARFYRALAVFLSDRLRTTVATLGYGKSTDTNLQDKLERENELDEGILDNVHMAGDRLRRLIAILEGIN